MFVGVLAAVETPLVWDPSPLKYTFAVEERIKGDPSGFVVIHSNADESACGVNMATSERWKIYAHREDLHGNVRESELWVWLCDANERLATGVPAPIVPGSAAPIVILGVGAGAILVVGVLLRRRSRATAG